MAKVSLRHIYKVYDGKVKAVSDFNLEIADKEFIVFVGPSGCGKSTTLRMIAGLEEITAGELWIGGRLCNHIEPKNRNIAMVFQNYALFPNMTVYDNMAFGLRMRKISDVKRDKNGEPVLDKNNEPIGVMRHYSKQEIDKRVRDAATILGITEYLDRKPKALSGGQRQRVALGRAIVREPNVFLFDEPLSNLDAKLRAKMRTEITKLHKRLDTTFIYVTHDQVEAMTMGDRIVVMKDGLVQQTDTPQNLYNYPVNKFVAGFIGTPQMNFFEVTLHREADGDVTVHHKHFNLRVPKQHTYHLDESYLDGAHPIIMGIRPEDISVADRADRSSVKAHVALVEKLGSQTLIYANTDENELMNEESKTAFCCAEAANCEIGQGALNFSFDTQKLQFFDAETELTVKHRVPTAELEAQVSENKLQLLTRSEILPPALRLSDGKYTVKVPASAVYFDSEGCSGTIEETDCVDGLNVYRINCRGIRVFCQSSEKHSAGDSVRVSVALQHVTICNQGEIVARPVNTDLYLKGTFRRKKADKQLKHCVAFGNTEIETPFDFNQKMYNLGRSVFKKKFAFETDSANVEFSDNGIAATVAEVLDYGTEIYTRIQFADGTSFFTEARDLPEQVCVNIDFDKVAVYDTDLDIRLF